MRVIGGTWGGRRLLGPPRGAETRPTSDRVREAVFNIVSSRVDGARVLDLFAGSGALGLEAASRGAAEVVLVERDAGAAGVCRRNAALVEARAPRGAAPRIQVVARPVAAYLEAAVGEWDLVFIDPPYELGEAELDAVLAALVPHLAPGATVVVERSTRSPEPAPPDGLELDRSRAYGETAVHLLSVTAGP